MINTYLGHHIPDLKPFFKANSKTLHHSGGSLRSVMSRILPCLLLVVAAAWVVTEVEGRKERKPWFCHSKDCPRFKTIKEWGPFAVRRYERSTWAAVCTPNAYHEEAVWRGVTELVGYIKGDNHKGNKLWGATPFARYVHVGPEHMAAWNATAHNETSVECLHKIVCVAYYLPHKYQHGKCPPRPKSREVRIVRVPTWTAFVSQFDGFPSKFRFILEYMRLVSLLKWHHVPFNWHEAIGFVYDPPFTRRHRHNEVLVPAGYLGALGPHGMAQLFGEGAVDLLDQPAEGVEQALAEAEGNIEADEQDALAALGQVAGTA